MYINDSYYIDGGLDLDFPHDKCINDDNDPNKEMQFICNLLYEIITLKFNDNKNTKLLYDSFPWSIKKLLKTHMKNALDFYQEVSKKYDIKDLELMTNYKKH